MLAEIVTAAASATSAVVDTVARPLGVISLAAVLAAVIGIERERRGTNAGLRTTVLVSAAAAAFGYLSVEAFVGMSDTVDPGRVASYVVSGVGFLGGGAIFASRGTVHGLTTAAAVWASAAVGLSVGVGEVGIGIALTAVTFLILWPLEYLTDGHLPMRTTKNHRLFVFAETVEALASVRDLLIEVGLQVREIDVRDVAGHLAADIVAHGTASAAERAVTQLRENHDDVGFVTTGQTDTPTRLR